MAEFWNSLPAFIQICLYIILGGAALSTALGFLLIPLFFFKAYQQKKTYDKLEEVMKASRLGRRGFGKVERHD